MGLTPSSSFDLGLRYRALEKDSLDTACHIDSMVPKDAALGFTSQFRSTVSEGPVTGLPCLVLRLSKHGFFGNCPVLHSSPKSYHDPNFFTGEMTVP